MHATYNSRYNYEKALTAELSCRVDFEYRPAPGLTSSLQSPTSHLSE